MLELSGVVTGYGSATAVRDISLRIDGNGALALLGRNGAGKSTTLKAIMGLVPAWSGSIVFDGTDITRLRPDAIARLGVGYVPEDRRVFTDLSVLENLETGAKPGPGGTMRWTQRRLLELFPEIDRRRHAAAGTLSGGERQMLAIARALMGNPRLLLLDEPSEGLAPIVVQRLATALQTLRGDGIGILISEQNRYLAKQAADDLVIMESGEIRFCGGFRDLANNPEITKNYLGV